MGFSGDTVVQHSKRGDVCDRSLCCGTVAVWVFPVLGETDVLVRAGLLDRLLGGVSETHAAKSSGAGRIARHNPIPIAVSSHACRRNGKGQAVLSIRSMCAPFGGSRHGPSSSAENR